MKPIGPFLEVVSGEPDAELEQLFGAARAWAEPSRENRDRVNSALCAALTPVSGTGSPPHAMLPGSVEPVRQSKLARRAPRAGRAPWLIIGGALIGALGFWLGHGVGYGVGYGAGERDAGRTSRADATATPAALPAATPAALPTLTARPEPVAATSAPTAAGAEAMARTEAMAPAPPRRAPRAARAVGPERAASAALAHPARLSFREVLDQLRRAQQQLRNRQATMSLLVLSELDRAAGDVLLEERNATRVLALCAAGQDEAARDVARRLEHDSPRSIYGMRLEASCAGDLALPVDGAPVDGAPVDGAPVDDAP